jgi:cobalt-zinc-cadmium efflux system outer membrane protein|tara:strand:+ start:21348 stop:22598 length:1251 start_codon:yes stop_codon:yes gene_type:complete
MFRKFIFVLILQSIISPSMSLAEEMSLESLLKRAYENNSLIQAQKAKFNAEDSLIAAKSTLDDPMVGISTLNRGNETTYGVISQRLRFPVKYYLQGKAQKSRALAEKAKLVSQSFEVRRKVIDAYYGIFALQKVIQLTEANMQAVREFSRVAERKYAAGRASQGDSMKAHFELTNLELDLIRFKQQEEAMQAKLRAILNDQTIKPIQLAKQELGVPTNDLRSIRLSLEKLSQALQEKSPNLQSEIHKLEEAETKSSLSKWEYAPDFQLQYQKRMSGLPEDSDIFMVQMSVPLWFWKKGSEASAASSRKMAQENRLRSRTDNLVAKIQDLQGKVETGAKTLKIYKTSLIPQAQGAYNSSKAAYRANKTSFLDLLDSERSLFKVRTGYYRSLQMYVSHLATLEAELGFEVSNINRGKK